MPLLAEIARTEGDDSPFVNYVVVPSFAGRNLTDRTCPHFDEWLANVSIKCSSPGRSWIYDHGLQLEGLESWDRYCTTGDELLEQLLVLQKKLSEDETIILIGHKLGCYILKKALITAWHNGHKDEYRQVLDMVETIMLIGEPSLNPKKPDEWIELISECISRKKGLPKKLATGFTVGCLQQISDKFEEILLFSTVFDVASSKRPGLKRKFRLKKMEHDGCIGCATVHVRLFTTSSEESLLETGPGDASVCPFHPKSIHFQHLLTLSPAHSTNLPQIGGSGRSNTIQDATTAEVANDALVRLHPPDQPVSTLAVHGEGSPVVVNAPREPSSPVSASMDGMVNSLNSVPAPIVLEPDVGSTETNDNSSYVPVLPSPNETEISRSTEETEAIQIVVPASTTIEESDEPSRPRRQYVSTFIPARDDFFYGRSEILRLLEEALLSPRIHEVASESALSEPRTSNLACIIGNAGIGKTSIANEFAYRFMHDFRFIVWLNASSEACLGKYCHDSAVALGLVNGRLSQDHNASRNILMRFLKDTRAPWLLVLDDCEEGVDISQYVPDDGMCSVLATSRRQPLTHSAKLWSVIEVPGFTLEEGARVLIKCLDAQITEEDADAICSVAVRYHFSPLSIRQLASWCNRESISFHQVKAMLGLDDLSLVRRHEPPIYNVTFTRMERLDPSASSLLAKLSFYDGSRVKERFVFSGQSRKLAILSRESPLSEDSESDAPTVLYKLALVDVNRSQSERIFYLHRSVQDAVRSRLDDETWMESFHEACGDILCNWPSPRKFKNIMGGFWEEFDDLHSHVHHLAVCLVRDRLEDRVASFDPGEEFLRLLVHHTWYNSRRGNQSEDLDLHDLAQFLITTIRRPQSGESHHNLPPRCLQVLDEKNEFTARLVDTRGLRDAPYVALSYQWGTSQHITPATLKEYARASRGEGRALDLSVLPQQISDAISFTRNMGYKYIWIDSVCMDQSNPRQLSEELAHLPEYYSNSAMIFCSLERGLSSRGGSSTATRFHLRWQPSQRLDISSYSILRSVKSRESSASVTPALESQWRMVFSMRDQCLLPGVEATDDGFRYWDIPGIEDAITTKAADPARSAEKSTGATTVTNTPTSGSEIIKSKKLERRPILKKRYRALRYRRRNKTLINPRRPAKPGRPQVDQLAALMVTILSMILNETIIEIHDAWKRGQQTLVRLNNENPRLRSYLFVFVLVLFSILLGNCMPRFVLV